MKHLYLLLFGLVFLIAETSIAQIINNGNTIKISQGTTLKINNGSYINENSGQIDNDGNIIIEQGNWYNNTGNNVFININNHGNVLFFGSFPQTIGGDSSATTFENLIINNSAINAINLMKDAEVTGNLILNDGIITTHQNKLIVSNSDSSAINGYDNSRFINGHLRRYITANTQTYPFPLGNGQDSNHYFLAELVNHNLSGINYIDATFGPLTHHNDNDMNVSEAGMSYNAVATEGVWYLTPDTVVTGGTFDLRCYINNLSGLYDNRFAILSRSDSSLTASDWNADPSGIGNPGINPIDGEGRLLSDGYALRQGYSHFSQFGIGKIECTVAHLPGDTNICEGDSLVLYPGDFASYSWSTGATDSAITITNAGQYIVEATNANVGCGTSTDTINVGITIIDYTIVSQDVTCYGLDNGQITIIPAGGIPDYHYQWSPSVGDTSTATNLSPGDYYATITDANGCKAYVLKVPITEPDSILLLTSTVNNPVCYGGNDGSIEVSFSGGTPPYNYYWNNNSTGNPASNLQAGTYILTLTDDNGCEAYANFSIGEPSPIIINADTGIDDSYYGYINLQVNDGTSPYAFSWSNGATTQDVSNLSSGTYIVTVTDFNGCESVDTFFVEIPLIIPTVITPNGDDINDSWDIINIESYNRVHIEIYNRWGDILYDYTGSGIGYKDKSVQWDGTWQGKDLPFTSYIYVVELNDGQEAYRGVVTLKR